MAFVWMKSDQQYFIASGNSLAEDTPCIRQRWRRVMIDRILTKVELTVPQPLAAECIIQPVQVLPNTIAMIDSTP
jgi:hypothetical protein